MSNMSISQKLHIPLILSILIGFVIIGINYFYSIDNMEIYIYISKRVQTYAPSTMICLTARGT